ncbi:ABC transporter substrate-binding protein [Lacticaseibacillus manihotivorans]|jgi:lactose/L-arabinose transport system substrate-binding protein|nr:extracellular solute-binding protein [Lacticaseibacillus manihotivorans]QFQ90026.1 extracellular solute-binding protein [Lacticaseibacillus manihotivorans]
MKKFRFKRLLLAAAAVTATVLLAACSSSKGSSSSSTSKDNKTLTVWCWDETYNTPAVKDAIKQYKKENGKQKVKVVTMAQDDIVQKLNTVLSSGGSKGLPNIVLIEDYRIQSYLKAYPDAFADLSSISKKGNFSSYKSAVNTVDGKTYGVPFDSGVAGLFYRTDLIKQAGYTDADMQNLTWDKYIEIGKQVKAKTGKAMLSLDPSDLGLIRIMMQSAGSWYTKSDGKTVNIQNNTALKQSISLYKQMMDAGIVEKVSGWDAGVAAVQKGQVASAPTGAWYSSTIQGAKDQSGKWKIAQIPRISENSKSVNASSIGGGGWYVIKGVGNVAGAKDFLGKTFASSPALIDQLAKDIGAVGTLKDAKSGANYKAAYPFYSNQKVFEDLLSWSNKVPEVNYGSSTYQIEDVMKDPVQSILKGQNINTVLKNAQAQAESAVQ